MAGFAMALVRHANLVVPILLKGRSSAIGRYFRSRPELLELLYGRFIAQNWSPSTKLRSAVSHVETVASLGPPVDFPADQLVELISLPSLGDYRLSLDQPRWLFREGQLALSLWEGVDRLFCITFSLISDGADRTAVVGGLQGRRQVEDEEDVLERYRRFTKYAHGSRPRDFVIEVFRMLCRSVGVTRILAVSDANHPLKGKNEGFTLRYDEAWLDRGGTDAGTGFYELALQRPDKSMEDVPAKKRSQYRKRIAMFDEIEAQLNLVVSGQAPSFQRTAAPELHAPVEAGGLEPLLLTCAFGLAVAVLAETGRLGGTWIGFGIGLAFVAVVYWLLKGNLPEQARSRISGVVRLRRQHVLMRAVCATAILAIAIAVDVEWGGDYALGRAFKLYFVPIFLSSLCFGTRITLGVTICAVGALNYLHLPPIYSLSVSSWTEVKDMLNFLASAIIVLLIPRLLLVSIDLAAVEGRRRVPEQ
jgi:uncharacterized protein VirK/YbjX